MNRITTIEQITIETKVITPKTATRFFMALSCDESILLYLSPLSTTIFRILEII